MKNRQAYMVGLNKMEIRETAVPEPKAGEVLVKVEYVGICGSDVHYFKDGRCGDFVVDGELMLGHEAGGVVVKVGEGVTDLVEGDKVALEPGITCGQCEFCKSGRYNLCPDVVFLATPPVQGCNEDYIAFPANMCFKLPEGMTT
ncbi:MAG: alcohol dehydrogenase catalytic domain-containing protein, partial [Anaerotignum sp.]|nr:alcohol dehydrogenase catalytic domain-containing protein [Anaerotignum sp.]